MTDTILSIRRLSKRFNVVIPTFRERLSGAFGRQQSDKNTFWSLQGINLEVARGESVGLIGRNGAGKSTLLKILARIIQPTSGEIDIYGKLGSLLEVGTGFHPDLTGRENVFLNGSILGMRYADIKQNFDEIVEFAGVEKFIDSQVKHFSSGMHLRLAFSVAAHFRPDILLLDEVLAVGDAAYQTKCLEKMKEINQDGRTIIFVSHDLEAIKNICSRAVLVENGRVLIDTEPEAVCAKYAEILQT